MEGIMNEQLTLEDIIVLEKDYDIEEEYMEMLSEIRVR
jgi:hypothetical protein